MILSAPIGQKQKIAATLLAVGMAVTVGTALGFQHFAGYIPCKLCLEQRTPYYIGVPILVLAALVSFVRAPAIIVRGLLLVGALLMVWSLYLGVFHAGVEWGWWLGPTDCGVAGDGVATGAGGVLDTLDSAIPPSCDQAAGRFIGLSFAGWNAVASLVLSAIGFWGALSKA